MENNKSYYWILVILFFFLSLIAGISGFQYYFQMHGEDYDIWRSLYRSFQLFTLENGDLEKPIPGLLNIARFSAPFTTLITLILTFLELFREQWKSFRIRAMNNHVVIIGLGNKGKSLADENLQKHESVLIIESDPLNPKIPWAKQAGCSLLIADATQAESLKKAQISRAKSVYVLMNDDNLQVKTCILIYKLLKESKRNDTSPLSCNLHLEKPEFLNTMRNTKLIQNTKDGLLLNIFNIYENSARDLFVNNPPDRDGIVLNSRKYVQIILFGFGKAGEALALQSAYTGHYVNGKKPKIVVIDRIAEEKVGDFLKQYPSFSGYCEIESITIEAKSPQLNTVLMDHLKDPQAFNSIVLCFDNKILNLLLGLQLEKLGNEESVEDLKIFVRTNDNESLETFSTKIIPYGLHSKVCSSHVIAGGTLDKKASIIHENYLKKRKKSSDFGSRETDVDWTDLSQEYKNSNRKVADHLGVKIRGIACEIVNMNDPRPATDFSEEEILILSELEHRRWSAERSLAGWHYADKKNDITRETPYLTGWDKLSQRIKDYDREVVAIIPQVLGEIGKKIIRKS